LKRTIWTSVVLLVAVAVGAWVVLRTPPREGRTPDAERRPSAQGSEDAEPSTAPNEPSSADTEDSPIVVAGVVLDAEGRPGAGIRMYCWDGEALPLSHLPALIRLEFLTGAASISDEKGRFTLREDDDGPFQVFAVADGRGAAAAYDVAKGTLDLEVRLTLSGKIRGIVVDGSGQAVVSACVAIRWFGPLTDAAGRFEVDLVPGPAPLSLIFEAKGFEEARVLVRPRPGEVIELAEPVVLRRLPGISGRVLLPDGTPAEGSLVRFRTAATYERRSRTDSAGRYIFTVDVPASWIVLAEDPRYVGTEAAGRRQAGETRFEMPDLRLGKAGAVAGRVVDHEGRPLAGARACAWAIQDGVFCVRGLDEHLQQPILSDADGCFRLGGLAAGRCTVHVTAGNGAMGSVADVAVTVGGETEVLVRVEPPRTIEGRVVDAKDTPISASIWSTRRIPSIEDMIGRSTREQVNSDEAGRFSLPVSGTAPVFVVAIASGYAAVEVAAVEPGTGDLVIRLGPPPTGVAAGRVVDAATGLPVPRAWVSALCLSRLGSGVINGLYDNARTEEDGAFRVEDIQPGQRCLSVRATGYAEGMPEIEIPDEGEATGIVVRLVRGGTVVGTVRDAEDLPLLNARVRIIPFGHSMWPLETMTDATGAYRIEHVSPGTHPVTLIRSQDSRGPQQVTVTEVTVSEGETTTLEIRE
jgi:Carboxypeptidase regulatory-like domain